mmetsp:Transcript_68022/g.118338  ORF Transcript_68022/g.118338 Transcript_68022/m.118338 type:complete len:82 (+) Transcript_68022:247-492(+)
MSRRMSHYSPLQDLFFVTVVPDEYYSLSNARCPKLPSIGRNTISQHTHCQQDQPFLCERSCHNLDRSVLDQHLLWPWLLAG